jgi:hypothetical protein
MGGFLSTVFLGNSVEHWFYALGFVLGGLIAGKLCSLIMSVILKKVCANTKIMLDDILVAALKTPLTFILMLEGLFLGERYLVLDETVDVWAKRIIVTGFILVVSWGVNRVIEDLLSEYVPGRSGGRLFINSLLGLFILVKYEYYNIKYTGSTYRGGAARYCF